MHSIRFSAFSTLLCLFSAAFALQGCTSRSPGDGAAATSAKTPRALNLAIWSNYASSELFAEFEKKTGIKVNVSNYSSNEELLAKLQAGAGGVDLAVPSDYMVYAMAQLKLLKPLDRSKIPNAKHIQAEFLGKSFDPKNEVSLPLGWGTTGIAINREQYKGPAIKGWKDLFANPALKGKVSLLDDARESLGAALKSLGLSLNSKDPAEIARAKNVLIQQRSRVKAFNSESKTSILEGEVAVAHIYSSDALQAAKESGGKVEYVIPEEGATLWIDNLVIPAGAGNPDEAHEFLDFMLEPKIGVGYVATLFLGTVNGAAMELVPAELKRNPSLFPAPAVRAKLEMMEDLGDAVALYDRAWTEIKAGN